VRGIIVNYKIKIPVKDMNVNVRSKRLIHLFSVILLSAFFTGGCASMWKFKKKDFKFIEPGKISSAGVGDIFFSYGPKSGTVDDLTRTPFEFSVIRLNDREIILKYVEYYQKEENGEWLSRAGVKTYTFPMSMDRINLIDYRFLILSYKDGKISYKRLK